MKAKLIDIEGRPLPIVHPPLGKEPTNLGPDDPMKVRYLADSRALGGRTLPWDHPDRVLEGRLPRKEYDALPVGEWDGDDEGNITRITTP